MATTTARRKFHVEIVKPSHYDDDGYVIQWVRAFIPSNSLACVYGLAIDAAKRRVLGDDVDIEVRAYDEVHTVIPVKQIIRRIQREGGIVLLSGVQTNQFPRATDLARQFRDAGIAVALGGFHVSGCLSMLPEIPPDIRAVQEMGVSLFAGEAEGRLELVFADADRGQLQPVYNYLKDLPDLRNQVTPVLPRSIIRKYLMEAGFDAGRGCPFQCSFCTIINVQGRKSRYRDVDDIEHAVRTNLEMGIRRFFITDDDFARNKNWEPIFDRLIELRHTEKLKFSFLLQVDTQCYKLPRFIEKAARAGCERVFIGMESIAPENLAAAGKVQNHVEQYRTMLQMWRDNKVNTIAGYILGFPSDTPESIARDIETIKRELPVDILEFFNLTPLPGSADHQALYRQGVRMETDMNNYDLEHITTDHARMTAEEWRGIYDRAWHLYYTPEHIETLLRRARASGSSPSRLAVMIMFFYGSIKYEKLHPLQGGFVRRKLRTARRPGLPRENPLLFYPRRLWDVVSSAAGFIRLYWQIDRIRRRVVRDPATKHYSDESLARAPRLPTLPILGPAPVEAKPGEVVLPVIPSQAAA